MRLLPRTLRKGRRGSSSDVIMGIVVQFPPRPVRGIRTVATLPKDVIVKAERIARHQGGNITGIVIEAVRLYHFMWVHRRRGVQFFVKMEDGETRTFNF